MLGVVNSHVPNWLPKWALGNLTMLGGVSQIFKAESKKQVLTRAAKKCHKLLYLFPRSKSVLVTSVSQIWGYPAGPWYCWCCSWWRTAGSDCGLTLHAAGVPTQPNRGQMWLQIWRNSERFGHLQIIKRCIVMMLQQKEGRIKSLWSNLPRRLRKHLLWVQYLVLSHAKGSLLHHSLP